MHAPTTKPARRILLLLACFLAAAAVNVVGWWFANRPAPTAAGASATEAAAPHVIASVSFAPFRRGQGPLNRVYPSAEEVESDLASLQGIARGVRTYTAREGLQVVPAVAGKYGLDVMQGVWLGREAAINDAEVEAGIRLANQYPDAIRSVVVGNEVLLRKDLTVDQLIAQIRKVKAAVRQPVTYADVWEFWLRFPQLLDEVDFVTVHFLPYWEDMPIGVDHAMPHIMDVYRQVQAALPGKPIVIGEVGWPSEGRSRREAVPSRIEAARFIDGFLQLAAREKLAYNLVEAFDQPWKVALEGTVGGAWGVLDEFRHPKFAIGGAVSNLPQWPLVVGLALLAALILMIPQAPRVAGLPAPAMLGIALYAQMLGAFFAAAIEHGLSHNFSLLRFAEFAVMTLLQAVFATLLYNELLDRLSGRVRPVRPLQPLATGAAALGGWRRLSREQVASWLFALFALLAVYHCLMLVVAGRYRDFPLDYFLLPLCGYLAMRLVGVAAGGGTERGAELVALGTGFCRAEAAAVSGPGGRYGPEAALAFLLLSLPVLVLLIETLQNREALWWCLLAAGYAVPLLGNLVLARRRAG